MAAICCVSAAAAAASSFIVAVFVSDWMELCAQSCNRGNVCQERRVLMNRVRWNGEKGTY